LATELAYHGMMMHEGLTMIGGDAPSGHHGGLEEERVALLEHSPNSAVPRWYTSWTRPKGGLLQYTKTAWMLLRPRPQHLGLRGDPTDHPLEAAGRSSGVPSSRICL